jgi:hypothetical protein
MKHNEADYVRAGYQYERGKLPAQTLRAMLEAETIEDRTEARHLIERGRSEARLSPK